MNENKKHHKDILKENQELKNELARLSEECSFFKENNRKYNELFWKIPLAYQSLDENACLIEVNPYWLRILGYVSEEVIGKNFSEFLHPDSKPTFRKNYPRFKQQGSIYDVSLKLRHKDGSYLDVLIDGMISYAPDGSFKRTHCLFRDITKLSRITKKLAESEMFLNRSQKVAGIGSFIWDLRNDDLHWSDNMYALHGLDKSSFRGNLTDMSRQVVHPADQDFVQEEILKMVRNKKVHPLEFRVIRTDGAERIIRTNGEFELDESGEPVVSLGIHQDITEQKAFEEKLKKSEKNYRSIYNKTPVMLHSIDREGKLISVSDYWLEVMGYKREEVIGKPSIDFLTEDSRKDAVGKHLQAFFKSGYARDVPYRFVKKNGEYIDVLMSAVGIRNKNGVITKSLAVLNDITARKRTEMALQESELRYRNLINTLPYGVEEVDPYGKILFVNDAFCKILGYDKEQLIGAYVWDHDPSPEQAKRVKDYIDYIRKERPEPGPFVSQNVRKDGKIIDVHVDWDYRFDPDDRLTGFISVVTDISRQKKAEEELVNKADQLHMLAAHLQKVREEERKSMAREVHDEFGQVLSALRMSLANIERELNKEKAIGNIGHILGEIEDSKLITGYAINAVKRLITELRPEILDVSGLIPALQWMVADFSKRNGIYASFDCGLETFNLDRTGNIAVFRLVQEGLNNISKHAGASMAVVKMHNENGQLLLEVEDNGKGFDKSEMNKGNSFGLIGMQERVLVLNGEMEIESEKGKGTLLKVRIPID